jgi:hypothetical protein
MGLLPPYQVKEISRLSILLSADLAHTYNNRAGGGGGGAGAPPPPPPTVSPQLTAYHNEMETN